MCKELISVVIPTYKRSDYICRAIESILKQTYKNIEIIVIDDNEKSSKDQLNTYKVLANYIENKIIKYYINDKVHGGSGARNKGIEVSSGNYIAFLDDDDEYMPEKIEKQLACFKKKNSKLALVYCYAIGVNKDKEKIAEYKTDILGNKLYESLLNCIAGTSLWMVKKDAIEDIGGFYNTPSKQDTITIIKLMEKGYEVDRVPEFLLYYYEYEGNKISGTGVNAINGRLNLREVSRNNYNKLTIDERQSLEKKLSKELITLYVINNKLTEAKKELKNLKKNNCNLKTLLINNFKINMRTIYMNVLQYKKKKRYK
ncbi:MAG: glycosyltransferase family 2 protein [Sarcina sp.]